MFGNLIKKFEALAFEEVAAQSVNQTKEKLIEVNKDQMQHGKNNAGEPIGKYRNRSYALKKNQINPLPGLGVPDLKLFGDYYSGIYAKVQGGSIEYGSTDEKATQLEKKYKGVYGLADPFKQKYEEVLRPVYIKVIKSRVGL